ncbi:cryptochrome/photolyase family protein [Arcobacter peruensis]|uniref:cryptochrome/photolyase family protein n=1 Tax=Arcobacter peruensis TaxID=2320140 RepID=UPI000F086B07|nr:cryptochrome/photolyase family protein [Arcobacter peruensis]
MNIFLLYPHQLFENIEKLRGFKILLIEEPLFFTQYKFHIQKLVMHRASMKFYQNYLEQNDIEVQYCGNENYLDDYTDENITIYDVVDDWLIKKISKNLKNLTILDNPNFLNPKDENRFFHKYYINRRKDLELFCPNGKPEGGKWSFDEQNRKKMPKDEFLPLKLVFENEYIIEAKNYCKKFDSFGCCDEFLYPVTFDEAKANLGYFLENKFSKYGTYQDAIVKDGKFLFHSNISSSLNIGLLDLNHVIEKSSQVDVPFNAKEGFIRQVIGWREFMLSIYKSSHIQLRTTNFFEFKNKMPKKILEAKSLITPLDDVIKKLDKTSYNHHIERLMILGNIFLLLEIDPNDVYEFFMSSYIDAYDWVMVGNVYGMSGFSDGGSITTKPYISSSNYIVKMSNDYKKSEAWCKIMDGLYWRFLNKYKELFKSNIRMRMQLAILEKMPEEKLQNHLQIAEDYLKELYDE